MPTLTKQSYIDALRDKIATMEGTAREIAQQLNAPTQDGEQDVPVTAETFYGEASADTILALEEAAATGSADAGAEAAWLLATLADVGQLDVSQGADARAAVAGCASAGLIPSAEQEAIVAAGREPDMSGPSWAESIGIGRVYISNIRAVQ